MGGGAGGGVPQYHTSQTDTYWQYKSRLSRLKNPWSNILTFWDTTNFAGKVWNFQAQKQECFTFTNPKLELDNLLTCTLYFTQINSKRPKRSILEFHLHQEQTKCFITNHSNITLKYHLSHSNLPTYVPQPLSKTSNFFTFFAFDPWLSRLKCINASFYHTHIIYPQCPSNIFKWKKLELFFQPLLADNTFHASESPNPKIILGQP